MSALPHFTTQQLQALTTEELQEVLSLTTALQRLTEREKLYSYYPDEGPLRRELYVKHCEFFAAGAVHTERALLGGNRSGKTLAGAYEMTSHLTGIYAHWWKGRRFDRPVRAWSAGDTAKTVRDIMQVSLLGPHGEHGTGVIPGDLIERTTPKQGIADAIESVYVRHISGKMSVLQFKSFDQGRDSFQGTSQEVIHLDEECPIAIYTECLLRTMTVNGIVYLTATPLLGMTELMLSFLPEWAPSES